MNALLVRYVPRLIGRARLTGRGSVLSPPESEREGWAGHVVLCGFGRVGSAVGEALDTFGVRYVVIEIDPDIVKGLHARGVLCLFGDGAHRSLLEAAGVARAALVVLALPEMDRGRLAVAHVRAINPMVPILARSHDRAHHEALRGAGVTEVIQPETEAAAALIGHALRRLALPAERTSEYVERFRDAMGPRGAADAGTRPGLPELRDVTLPPGDLADQSLREARVRERFGVTVVAITRTDNEMIVNPSADTLLRPGDRLRVFGLPAQIAAFVDRASATPDT